MEALVCAKPLEIDRTERKEAQRTRKRPNSDRDRTGYYLIYRNALNKFSGEDTKDVLLSLLGDATFGEIAAFELIRFGSSKPRENSFRSGPSFEMIAQSRAATASKLVPVATAVLRRIDELLATGQPENEATAAAFATAAVQMNFGNDATSIFKAAENAPSIEGRYNLLATMLVFGLKVPAKWIAAGYENAHRSYFEAKWQDPKNWWIVRRWIELLGASDDPESVFHRDGYLPTLQRG